MRALLTFTTLMACTAVVMSANAGPAAITVLFGMGFMAMMTSIGSASVRDAAARTARRLRPKVTRRAARVTSRLAGCPVKPVVPRRPSQNRR
ncbi:hypothetical protein [Jannaschia sp. LMIT008]|uniref:hypothetical protein n=1 Tax=Jannaschia maritima TaxID=3032585 RepID=UPI00281126EF|nr:hypothetical protein [Jannaschia sp. LMIT008]